jgi:cell division protein FtsW
LKYIGVIVGWGLYLTFLLIAKAFPGAFNNRVSTWESQIENYLNSDNEEDEYQIEKLKFYCLRQNLWLGPGKSVQKKFSTTVSSDFIYAIIVEEYGLIGGLGVLFYTYY